MEGIEGDDGLGGEGSPGTGRLVLRLVAGCVSLAGGQLGAELRGWDRAGRANALEAPSASRRLHQVVGLCVRGRHHVRSATARARGALVRRAARAAPLWRRLGRTGFGRAVQSRARSWASRAREELALAEALGRVEEIEGRALAREAVQRVSGRLFEALGENPELRSLVAAQSATLTTVAVEELRTAVVDADSKLESSLHRWLEGRRARLAALRSGPPRGE